MRLYSFIGHEMQLYIFLSSQSFELILTDECRLCFRNFYFCCVSLGKKLIIIPIAFYPLKDRLSLTFYFLLKANDFSVLLPLDCNSTG